MANAIVVLAPFTITSASSYSSGTLGTVAVGASNYLDAEINITALTGNGAVMILSRVEQDGTTLTPLGVKILNTVGPAVIVAGSALGSPFFDNIQLNILADGNEVFSGVVSITGRV